MADGQSKKKEKNNSLLLGNRSVPLKKLSLWHFKLLPFGFLRCWMQEEPFRKHTRVAAWQQKSLSDFLGTLSVEMKSQTMKHSGEKISLFIQLQHLFTCAVNFQGKENIHNPNKEKGNTCWISGQRGQNKNNTMNN